jgi:GT2 family glycosyltransferase
LAEYKTWLPLKIIVAPDANISEGRNLAIAAAAGPIIAATDAGVVLAPYWLEELIQPIRESWRETAVPAAGLNPTRTPILRW